MTVNTQFVLNTNILWKVVFNSFIFTVLQQNNEKATGQKFDFPQAGCVHDSTDDRWDEAYISRLVGTFQSQHFNKRHLCVYLCYADILNTSDSILSLKVKKKLLIGFTEHCFCHQHLSLYCIVFYLCACFTSVIVSYMDKWN